MIPTPRLIDAVCEHFQVTHADIKSQSRKAPLPLARKILIHLLGTLPVNEIREAVGLSACMIYQMRGIMIKTISSHYELSQVIAKIESIASEMNLKLNTSQLQSLHEVLTQFLKRESLSVTEELLCLILDEINEKLRKRIRSRKENMSLDEKQIRAFIIWHFYASRHYEHSHPHAYMTMLDIIQQLKPEKKRIPIIN